MKENNSSEELVEFSPVWWARGCHLQTVLGLLTNRAAVRFPVEKRRIELSDGEALVAEESGPSEATKPKAVALLMHGLGGDAESKYMVSAANRFNEMGWSVFRLNHRGAGSGAGLSERMYHSGLHDDLEDVLNAIEALHPGTPVVAVGYSLSGNLLLGYLGKKKDKALGRIAGAIAVNPPVNLGKSMAMLDLPQNRIYRRRFTRLLCSQLNTNSMRMPVSQRRKKYSAKTIRQLDDEITAPDWDFLSADDYYEKASATNYIEDICIKTLVLTCDDDPFVDANQFGEIRWPGAVTVRITRGGGHMGYLNKEKTPLGDRRWLDYAVVSAAARFID